MPEQEAYYKDILWPCLVLDLQSISLFLRLDKGIPRALAQLTKLVSLRLTQRDDLEPIVHPLHLTRPLNVFLDIPRMEKIELHSYDGWTSVALELLDEATCFKQGCTFARCKCSQVAGASR